MNKLIRLAPDRFVYLVATTSLTEAEMRAIRDVWIEERNGTLVVIAAGEFVDLSGGAEVISIADLQ